MKVIYVIYLVYIIYIVKGAMFGFELFEAVAPFLNAGQEALNAGPGFPTFALSRGAPAGAKSTGVSRGPAAGSRLSTTTSGNSRSRSCFQ